MEYAEIVRRIAADNPTVADYKTLSSEMLDEIAGHERDLLARLLPGYMRAVLSRRTKTGDEQTWEDFLTERIATESRGTIFVADATGAELDRAAERRERFAGNLDRKAVRLRRVSKAMLEQQSETVRALPATIGAEALHDVEKAIALTKSRRAKAESQAKTIASLERCLEVVNGWIIERATPTVTALRERRAQLDEIIWQETKSQRQAAIYDELLEEMMAHG